MFIPLEIVRETIETAYILNSPPNRPLTPRDIGVSTKPPWKTLAALSCTSHAFREIVLEVWFSTLRVTSPEDLEHGCRTFPRVSKWTRSLHCHLNLPLVARFNLSGLQALHAIRIHNSLFPNFGVGHFVSPFDLLLNVPPGVVQVQIASTVVFPPHAFKFNSISSFANIRALDWVTNNAWCDLCHIDQAVVVRKPFPQSVVYEGGKAGLPVHFRKQLSCLQHLETVSFTITVFQLPGSPPTYGVSLGDTQHAWTGECEDCIQTVLSDESFRSRWTALKTGEVEEMEGSGGKKYRFYPIPSLRRVEWNFDHPGAGAEVEEDVEEDELEEEEGGGEGSGSWSWSFLPAPLTQPVRRTCVLPCSRGARSSSKESNKRRGPAAELSLPLSLGQLVAPALPSPRLKYDRHDPCQLKPLPLVSPTTLPPTNPWHQRTDRPTDRQADFCGQ